MERSGLLLIDKEEGVTSRFVDNKIGRLFKTRKVGHLGTLDPFATGLLIVAVNGGTKYLPYLPESKKTYRATLSLGIKTDSGDKDGSPIESKVIPSLSKEVIESVFSSLLGKQKQLPPLRSAIKVNGKPLYRYALEGKEVEIKPRDITVYSLSLLSFEPSSISFEATVSKGTYIRSLGEGIASRLGTVGYLSSLRRLTDGRVSVDRAKRLREISEGDLLDPSLFLDMPSYDLTDLEWAKVKNGCKIPLDLECAKVLLRYQNRAVFVYRRLSHQLFEAERGLF